MPDVTIADVMQAYSEDAVRYAERQVSIALDFSERSLEGVDRILTNYNHGQLLLPDSLSDAQCEELWVFCKMIGGYVGEVVIRNIGGQWHMRDVGDGAANIKLITTGGVEGSPPDAVWRTLTEPFRSIVSYYRGLRAILGHGQEKIENESRTVHLPPLSNQPPQQGLSENQPK